MRDHASNERRLHVVITNAEPAHPGRRKPGLPFRKQVSEAEPLPTHMEMHVNGHDGFEDILIVAVPAALR